MLTTALHTKTNPWQKKNELDTSALSKSEKSWLMDTYVLTQSLNSLEDATCRLDVLDERLDVLSTDERSAFMKNSAKEAWVRQIYHLVEGTPVIYARTVVPTPTFNRFKADFLALKSQPIGVTLLYDRPEVTRSCFTYRQIKAHEPIYQNAFLTADNLQHLWARRSLFYINELPLLISEVFMSTMQQYAKLA